MENSSNYTYSAISQVVFRIFLSVQKYKNVVKNNSSSGWFFVIYLFQFDRFMFKILAHGPARVINARIFSTNSLHYKITVYFCESHTSLETMKMVCKWKFRKPTRGVQFWLLFLLSLHSRVSTHSNLRWLDAHVIYPWRKCFGKLFFSSCKDFRCFQRKALGIIQPECNEIHRYLSLKM